MKLWKRIIFAGCILGESVILYGFSITPGVVEFPGLIEVILGIMIIIDALLLAMIEDVSE